MKSRYLKNLFLCLFLVAVFVGIQKFSHNFRSNGGHVLGLSILPSPKSTSSPDSVKAQVQALIQENMDLKSKVQQLDMEITVRRTLKRGMSGDDVMAMQKLLQKAQGDLSISLSGHFGKATEKAVRAFQQQENLPVNGIVTKEVISHLNSLINKENLPDPSVYDSLLQQLDDVVDSCSLVPQDSLPSDGSENIATISAGSLLCPAGCVAQDQVPDCSVPDTSPVVPDIAPAPVVSSPASSSPATLAISNIVPSSVTASGATIKWDTNIAADSQVEYGKTTSYGQTTTLNAALVTAHSVSLSGLTASTTYHFKVKSKISSTHFVISADQTFTTTAPPDTTPPIISNIKTSNATTSSVTVTWTTNENSDTQVDYGTTSSYGNSTGLNSLLTTSHTGVLSGLLPSTQYHFRVKSKDAAGNLATSGDQTFTTIK